MTEYSKMNMREKLAYLEKRVAEYEGKEAAYKTLTECETEEARDKIRLAEYFIHRCEKHNEMRSNLSNILGASDTKKGKRG